MSLYVALSERAATWLRPGGSLLVFCGKAELPTILAHACWHLTYHWLLSYRLGGPTRRFYDRRVNEAWRPVLWCTRGAYRGPWLRDEVEGGGRDKRYHAWGQAEQGFRDVIARVSRPGELVLDPFVGGGTTAVAAILLGRRFIGVDSDPAAIETTRARLADALAQE